MNLVAFTSLLLTGAKARTWASSDGSKTFEGELKTYDPTTGMVGVMSSTGQEMVELWGNKIERQPIASLDPGYRQCMMR